jgi:peptidoglycan/LPS O-acetylase OafA/YrhL
MMAGKSIERGAYRTIDFVRAAAAIAVVWNHSFNMLLQAVRPSDGAAYVLLTRSASFGRDAVMVFFVISGYWIARSVTSSVAGDRWSWPDYTINRLSRLYIVLVPALALGLLLDASGRFLLDVAPYRALGFQESGYFDVGSNISPAILLGNLAFLQEMVVPPLGSNSPLWTLSREFWYYIWFPALYLAVRGRPSWPALILTAATAMLAPSVVALFGCWLLGAGVAWIEPRIGRAVRTDGWGRRFALLAGLGLWGAGTLFARVPGLNYYVGCYAISASFAILLLVILRYDIDMPKLAWPIATFGAKASFSLYAYHMPVLVVIIAIICGANPLSLSAFNVLVAIVVTIALTFGALGFAGITERNTGWLRDLLRRRLERLAPKLFVSKASKPTGEVAG